MTVPTAWPIVNSHVHLPPNFSAFTTVDDAIAAARAEGVRAFGISNFYDQRIYPHFGQAALAAGILPLYGLEFITQVDDLAAAGIRVNDPANPGRFYLCGKGIDVSRPVPATVATIRRGNDERAAAMVAAVRRHLLAADWPQAETLTAEGIAAGVADRAGVPVEWVSLQERHIAQAIAELLAGLTPDQRAAALARAYGQASGVDPDNAAAVQGEIRARLLRAGQPGFVPEVPVSFEAAYDVIVAMRGIPVYPTLADGAQPVCPFEAPPAELARQLAHRGIHATELIPNRNRSAVVDDYVRAFDAAGLIVMAGTEHNTPERLAFDPVCADGPASSFARQRFWQGTCVVAAHQWLVAQGQPGFVDDAGRRTAATITELADLGAGLIAGQPEGVAHD